MTDLQDIAVPKEEKSKARRAYGWYKIYSRLKWVRRAWWFFWDFKTKADTIAAIAALGVVGTAAGMTTYDAVEYKQRIEASKTQIEAIRWSNNSSVYTVTGRDRQGRKARFDMLVLDKNYTWVAGSWSALEHNGKRLSDNDIAELIFNRQIRNGLARSGEFITVGVASSEGDPIEEKQRAARRAKTSAAWLRRAMGSGVRIMQLNLGQHQNTCDSCETDNTSWQRPFMIIAVRGKDPGVILRQALRDAFSGKSNLPSPDNYSAFTLSAQRSS